MTCHAHPWGLLDGLSCTRTDPHSDGHVFQSTTADEHADGSER